MPFSQYDYFGEDEFKDIVLANNNSSLVTGDEPRGIVMVLKDAQGHPILSGSCFSQKGKYLEDTRNYQFAQSFNEILDKYFRNIASPEMVLAINESFAREEVFFNLLEFQKMTLCVSEVPVPSAEFSRKDYVNGRMS